MGHRTFMWILKGNPCDLPSGTVPACVGTTGVVVIHMEAFRKKCLKTNTYRFTTETAWRFVWNGSSIDNSIRQVEFEIPGPSSHVIES